MDFFKNVADSVTKAVDYVVDKNREAAMINRLKIVIKNEKEKQISAYTELGKYYYRNMRDTANNETEHSCVIIENSSRRLSRAVAKLDEITAPDTSLDEGNEGSDDMDESAKPDSGEYKTDDTKKSCGGFEETDSGDYGDTAAKNEPDESFEGFPHICRDSEDKDTEEAADDDNPPFKP